ncbi:MAG: hypothetical protein ABI646_05235 [Acidobacteriota bacterium]
MTPAQDNPAEGVMLFNGRDGKGMSQPLPMGVFQVSGKQLGSADVSVTVSKGFVIRFCSEKDGTGKCEEFSEGTHNLTSTDFNFIKIWQGSPTTIAPATDSVAARSPSAPPAGTPPPLIVFELLNWLGRAQGFSLGMYRSFRGEFGKLNDNQARSIIVGKGYRARLCSEEGMNYRGAGDCEVHEEGRHNLRFSNTISFIEVTDLARTDPDDEKLPVTLYEDASQAGRMQGFDVGEFFASKGEFKKLGDDKASSLVVRDGYRASICSDEPAAGREAAVCEEFGPGRRNLKNRGAASYLKVWKDSK